ncbi:hypothetical protein TNCV_4090891, partial [Trichonephila clavipes]
EQESVGSGLGHGKAMIKSGVGSFEQLLLYADEHYLEGCWKIALGDHLGRFADGVEEPIINVTLARYVSTQIRVKVDHGYRRI